jgi:hypothetical protein
MEFNLYGVKRENSYGEFFTSIGLNINHKYAWGVKDDEPIYDITFDIDDDQSEHREGIDYWGWLDYDEKRMTMVWSNWTQFFACFPYGVEASEKSGQGKAYRLKIVNAKLVK